MKSAAAITDERRRCLFGLEVMQKQQQQQCPAAAPPAPLPLYPSI